MKEDFMRISEVETAKNNSRYDRSFAKRENKDRGVFLSTLKAQMEEDKRTGKFKKTKNDKNDEDREL